MNLSAFEVKFVCCVHGFRYGCIKYNKCSISSIYHKGKSHNMKNTKIDEEKKKQQQHVLYDHKTLSIQKSRGFSLFRFVVVFLLLQIRVIIMCIWMVTEKCFIFLYNTSPKTFSIIQFSLILVFFLFFCWNSINTAICETENDNDRKRLSDKNAKTHFQLSFIHAFNRTLQYYFDGKYQQCKMWCMRLSIQLN